MITIIGIDFACDPVNVGVASAVWDGNKARIEKLRAASKKSPPLKILIDTLPKNGPTLLALDAPLGWPSKLASSLNDHKAGHHIPVNANNLFHRHADDVVHARLGKRPLERGANLIARTAHAALDLLQSLREYANQPIPLAWEPSEVTTEESTLFAIEVYPAATLKSHGLPCAGYKKNGTERKQVREQLVNSLADILDIGEFGEAMLRDDDQLDAVTCVLAAIDFLAGKCFPVDDHEKAEKEGWIWFRNS